jgi:hypothetical protein
MMVQVPWSKLKAAYGSGGGKEPVPEFYPVGGFPHLGFVDYEFSLPVDGTPVSLTAGSGTNGRRSTVLVNATMPNATATPRIGVVVLGARVGLYFSARTVSDAGVDAGWAPDRIGRVMEGLTFVHRSSNASADAEFPAHRHIGAHASASGVAVSQAIDVAGTAMSVQSAVAATIRAAGYPAPASGMWPVDFEIDSFTLQTQRDYTALVPAAGATVTACVSLLVMVVPQQVIPQLQAPSCGAGGQSSLALRLGMLTQAQIDAGRVAMQMPGAQTP